MDAWGDEIQDELATRIGKWFDQLESLSLIVIRRYLRFALPVKKKEIMTFVDASVRTAQLVISLQSMKVVKSVVA